MAASDISSREHNDLIFHLGLNLRVLLCSSDGGNALRTCIKAFEWGKMLHNLFVIRLSLRRSFER